VKSLSSKFGHIRRTRPDGNCFYRALSFAYFEHLLSDRAEFDRFRSVIIPTKEKLAEAGFPVFTAEEFYDNFVEVLDRLQVYNFSVFFV
jgi:ubiquitin thioesterase protein OTUB1